MKKLGLFALCGGRELPVRRQRPRCRPQRQEGHRLHGHPQRGERLQLPVRHRQPDHRGHPRPDPPVPQGQRRGRP
ncbi:MAG: hypothetical protein R3F43_02160 [bacterium]